MKPLKGLLRACRGDLTVDSFVWIANDVQVIGQVADVLCQPRHEASRQ